SWSDQTTSPCRSASRGRCCQHRLNTDRQALHLARLMGQIAPGPQNAGTICDLRLRSRRPHSRFAHFAGRVELSATRKPRRKAKSGSFRRCTSTKCRRAERQSSESLFLPPPRITAKPPPVVASGSRPPGRLLV